MYSITKITIYNNNNKSVLGTGALQHPHVQPCGHFHFCSIHFVGMQHLQRFQLRWSTARSWDSLGILLPYHTLKECMMMRRVIAWWTSSMAIASIEAEWLHDKLESLDLLEDDVQSMTTTSFVTVRTFRSSGHSTTSMASATMIASSWRLIVAMLSRSFEPFYVVVVGIWIRTTNDEQFRSY